MKWYYDEEDREIQMSLFFWMEKDEKWSEDYLPYILERTDLNYPRYNGVITKYCYQVLRDWFLFHVDVYNSHIEDEYLGYMDDYYGVARLECEDI